MLMSQTWEFRAFCQLHLNRSGALSAKICVMLIIENRGISQKRVRRSSE